MPTDAEKPIELGIGEIARRSGAATSAIRYYEAIGLLPPAERRNGRRRYDLGTLQRLYVIQHARQAGFTLAEIRRLFFGFVRSTHPEVRWQVLARQKLAELEQQQAHIRAMQDLLQHRLGCDCTTPAECALWQSGSLDGM